MTRDTHYTTHYATPIIVVKIAAATLTRVDAVTLTGYRWSFGIALSPDAATVYATSHSSATSTDNMLSRLFAISTGERIFTQLSSAHGPTVADLGLYGVEITHNSSRAITVTYTSPARIFSFDISSPSSVTWQQTVVLQSGEKEGVARGEVCLPMCSENFQATTSRESQQPFLPEQTPSELVFVS